MAIILTIANQKGGVGKTTTSVNLAAGLVRHGKRVLLVDLDPQGNATMGSGIDKRRLDLSLYHVLIGHSDVRSATQTSEVGGYQVLPANRELAGAEIELVDLEAREGRLRRALQPVQDDYDFVLIDAPPSLSILTLNGLCAANGVIIPMQCEYFALEGLSDLVNTIRKVHANFNTSIRIIGILRVMFDRRMTLSQQVSAQLEAHFKDKVFTAIVPRNVRLAEAPSHGMPGVVFDETSRGAQAYLQFAEELIEKTPLFGGPQPSAQASTRPDATRVAPPVTTTARAEEDEDEDGDDEDAVDNEAPTKAARADTAPAGPEPTGPEPTGPEPTGPEPVSPEPVSPEPASPEPASPESSAHDSTAHEPAAPEHFGHEPSQHEPSGEEQTNSMSAIAPRAAPVDEQAGRAGADPTGSANTTAAQAAALAPSNTNVDDPVEPYPSGMALDAEPLPGTIPPSAVTVDPSENAAAANGFTSAQGPAPDENDDQNQGRDHDLDRDRDRNPAIASGTAMEMPSAPETALSTEAPSANPAIAVPPEATAVAEKEEVQDFDASLTFDAAYSSESSLPDANADYELTNSSEADTAPPASETPGPGTDKAVASELAPPTSPAPTAASHGDNASPEINSISEGSLSLEEADAHFDSTQLPPGPLDNPPPISTEVADVSADSGETPPLPAWEEADNDVIRTALPEGSDAAWNSAARTAPSSFSSASVAIAPSATESPTASDQESGKADPEPAADQAHSGDLSPSQAEATEPASDRISDSYFLITDSAETTDPLPASSEPPADAGSRTPPPSFVPVDPYLRADRRPAAQPGSGTQTAPGTEVTAEARSPGEAQVDEAGHGTSAVAERIEVGPHIPAPHANDAAGGQATEGLPPSAPAPAPAPALATATATATAQEIGDLTLAALDTQPLRGFVPNYRRPGPTTIYETARGPLSMNRSDGRFVAVTNPAPSPAPSPAVGLVRDRAEQERPAADETTDPAATPPESLSSIEPSSSFRTND